VRMRNHTTKVSMIYGARTANRVDYRSPESTGMNKNLGLLLLILLTCSLLARRTPPQQWPDSWREELEFRDHNLDWGQVLMVTEDRYAYFASRPGPWELLEQGIIQATPNGEFLLIAPNCAPKSAHLAGKKLSTPWGIMELEHHTVPRLRPTAAMVQTGQPFSIEGIRLGMSRSEVQKLYPHYATSFHEPDVFFYGDFPHGARVNYGPSNRVKTISGDRLEQSGRRLFNERSRLSDVERLFSDQLWAEKRGSWTMNSPDKHLTICGQNGPDKHFNSGFRFILDDMKSP